MKLTNPKQKNQLLQKLDLSIHSPIPESGIQRAVELMESGLLYRYDCTGPESSEVALLEREFAEFVGSKYALAVNSCGSALYISMLCLGVKPGDEVLSSGFTYTACPSAIVNIGATPVLVDCTKDYVLDTEDLKRKITQKTKVLLLSHMRGHVSDMDEIVAICEANSVILLEDCAHSLGTTFGGKHTGLFGKTGCFSSQSHKMINSGEGGIVVTDDEEIIAKAILYAGSQETFWQKHFVDTPYLAKYQEVIPNISCRMSNLSAAILRAQIPKIKNWMQIYQSKHEALKNILLDSPYIHYPKVHNKVVRGPDTVQFNLVDFSLEELAEFTTQLSKYGIKLKTFGNPGNPRFFKSWKYIPGIEKVSLPQIETILPFACDLRLPLPMKLEEIYFLGEIILGAISKIKTAN